ncbi:MAG TPA: LamG-like jellyroll fold domain-containing protein [Chryseosolibacter sp.]|nr:LamG-like jellyroll fold domain-containing protein [Chryseosolibacter sp.]
MRPWCFLFALSVIHQLSFCQVDNIGAGHSIYFDGVDDYVDLGNIYDDLQLPVTISVWINVANVESYFFPVFQSQDNLPLYNGVIFLVRTDLLSISYGDGRGENNPAFRRGKDVAVPSIANRWVNVTAVMRSGSDMQLFLNGEDLGGNFGGSSTFPMSSDHPADVAKIGYWLSNGIISRFKGYMDELRIYNRALTENEIRETMCRKLTGSEPGLIGYWTFDETSGNTLYDKSPNQFHGELIGNPQRVFSGAPVGDESVFKYTPNWTNETLTMGSTTVSDVIGNPFGVHLYKVNEQPSQRGGLPTELGNEYYGVFIAAEDAGHQFTFSYTSDSCEPFSRKDNATASWAHTGLADFIDRIELVAGTGGSNFEVDLGADTIVCDEDFLLLDSQTPTTDDYVIEWTTGESTQTIEVTTSGEYGVTVTDACHVYEDAINVIFKDTPPEFTLGDDVLTCTEFPITLQPFTSVDGFTLEWMDGSNGDFLIVSDYGEYSVRAFNECGITTDTITFSWSPSDFILDIGTDTVLCQSHSFLLSSGNIPDDFHLIWSTGAETNRITITEPGDYSLKVFNDCEIHEDTIRIVFKNTPPDFTLGDDVLTCTEFPTTLQPFMSVEGFTLEWMDGSNGDFLIVSDYGEYSVRAFNECGTTTDTIAFSWTPSDFILDIGNDTFICQSQSFLLSPGEIPDGFHSIWSTGAETNSITITEPGDYSLQVFNDCESHEDTIKVVNGPAVPPSFSLGADSVFCSQYPVTLKPLNETESYSFQWQDGSEAASFDITADGTYELTVSNKCGIAKDSITFLTIDLSLVPNIITPNEDGLNERFLIPQLNDAPVISIYNRWGELVFNDAAYQGSWNGVGLSNGVYFYTATTACGDIKGTVTIRR